MGLKSREPSSTSTSMEAGPVSTEGTREPGSYQSDTPLPE